MIKRFDENIIGRDFVVGDIHGCFTMLQEKLDFVGFNVLADRLFCVGDLVDRGPESEEVVEWLNKPWFNSVRGNHEQMAIDTFYGDTDKGLYFQNGGAWFLGLAECEQRCYVDLFESLPIIIEVKTKDKKIGIVHAEYPVNDWSQLDNAFDTYGNFKEACLWARSRISFKDDSDTLGVDLIYAGHTPVDAPITLGNTVFIDTGAVFDGEMTLIEI